jgi:hypothetical protein
MPPLSAQFSEQTQAVLSYFDQYTGGNVRKMNDIGTVLEAASQLAAAEEFNALVFAGKCVWNLYTTISKVSPNDEGYQHLEREFASNVHDVRERLVFFAANISPEQRTRFEQTYLSVTQGTMRNVVDLAHDLARFKDMQSDQR